VAHRSLRPARSSRPLRSLTSPVDPGVHRRPRDLAVPPTPSASSGSPTRPLYLTDGWGQLPVLDEGIELSFG
jgi:hypothetical protein